MKIVGLTGGIGSGKTTIANMFRDLGVPIYIADTEAKTLMNNSKIIKRKIIEKFGTKSYHKDGLDRNYLASRVFSDKNSLNIINSIVHPKVAAHFANWVKKQDNPYVIKEAAVIFENGMEDQYDFIITVTADKNERIKRILARDSSTKERILSIMDNQLSDEEKSLKSDFVIQNNDLKSAREAVLKIHNSLMKRCVK